VKYAKHPGPVPPLAPPGPTSREAWQREHGARDDGSLHPASGSTSVLSKRTVRSPYPAERISPTTRSRRSPMTSGGRWSGSARSASCGRWAARNDSFDQTTLMTSRKTNAHPKH
jgi:hypothetical protein